jgi:hypothetical protein
VVTKTEFYSNLAAVWIFLLIILTRLPETGTRSVVLIGSAVMVVVAIFQILRSRLTESR